MSLIPLSQPDITEHEIEAVVAALRSNKLSIGPRQVIFEELIAARAGRSHGVAVNSGTSGLHLLMLALGIGPGDEVITTPFSFIASANCILMVGAKPVFVDIDPRTLNMDPAKAEAAITDNTKAIVAVEVFGNPTGMDSIASIARKHELPLIEDSCEGLGGRYKNKPVGSFGRAGVFAFYPNKQITTGEGGVIVTDDDTLAEQCRSLRNQGRCSIDPKRHGEAGNPGGSWLSHDRLGFNYRLSEIAAALGIAQMQRLDEILDRRRKVAGHYIRELMDCTDIVLPNIEEPATMSWFVFVIRMTHSYTQVERDRIMAGMHRHEVGCANYFPCIHLQPFYKQMGYKEGDFPVAESVSQRTIALPFFNRLDEKSIQHVVATLKLMIAREQLSRP